MTSPSPSTTLITGATSGTGLALTKKLADTNEDQLVVTGRRDASQCSQDLPAGVDYIQADLASPDAAAEQIALAFEQLGHRKLDRLVLNAGIGFHAPVDAESAQMIRQTLDVNLVAAVLLVHKFAPLLEAARGKVVFIGSVAHGGAGNMPSYAASKAGIAGLARALQSEWQGRIDVQVIHPGPTVTSMHEKAGYEPGRLQRLFFSAEQMADEVAYWMKRDRKSVSVMFAARLRRLVLGRRK